MQSNGVRIHKYCNGEDVTRKSAFAYGDVLEVFLHVPRTLGESGVVLLLTVYDRPAPAVKNSPRAQYFFFEP